MTDDLIRHPSMRAMLDATLMSIRQNETQRDHLDSINAALCKNFGALARAEREAKGISLRDLARALDISPSFLSEFERGSRWSDRIADAIVSKLSP